jgi:hypothetical protein
MDTSNSPKSSLNVRVVDLRSSPHEEDHKVAARCEKLLGELLEKLIPILRYVSSNVEFRSGINGSRFVIRCLNMKGVSGKAGAGKILNNNELFLSDKGDFFIGDYERRVWIYSRNHDNGHTAINCDGGAPGKSCCWWYFNFDELIVGLRDVLVEAERKREEHLAVIRQRRQALDEMAAALGKM